jgi:hypothetical protein
MNAKRIASILFGLFFGSVVTLPAHAGVIRFNQGIPFSSPGTTAHQILMILVRMSRWWSMLGPAPFRHSAQ